MAHLRPCESCLRHVRADAAQCPFCDRALSAVASPVVPTARLGRAARMAFGAAVAGATLAAACGGNKPAETGGTNTTTPAEDTGAVADDDAATPPPAKSADPNMAKPYGAPPADGLLV